MEFDPEIDGSRKGEIDTKSLEKKLLELLDDLSEDDAHHASTVLDTNLDGSVSREEFLDLVVKVGSQQPDDTSFHGWIDTKDNCFVDSDFPPQPSSLCQTPGESEIHARWIRLKDIANAKDKVKLFDDIEPSDVCQVWTPPLHLITLCVNPWGMRVYARVCTHDACVTGCSRRLLAPRGYCSTRRVSIVHRRSRLRTGRIQPERILYPSFLGREHSSLRVYHCGQHDSL